jgi:outer membrane protein assembly factor BamB
MKGKLRVTLGVLLIISILTLTLYFSHGRFYLAAGSSPQWRNQAQDSSVIPEGGCISLQAEGFDSGSLNRAVLATNETGAWRNETEHTFMWAQPAVYGFDNFGTATYENGILYAPSKSNHVAEGRVFAINASDGNLIWNVTARMVDGSPCIDGDVIYIGEGFSVAIGESVPSPRAIALNKTDGQKIWQTDIGFIVCTVAYHEGVVFVSTSNSANPQGQYALNATDGEILWRVNHGASWDSSPVIYNGLVIQVAREMLYPNHYETVVLNESNGKLIRRFESRGSQSTPLVHNGIIFIPDDDWRIWAFDLETGDEVWNTTELHDGSLQDNSYCSPAAAGGAIYYQSLNGTFYVIDESNGDVLWSYALGGLGLGSPSIGGGCVFITNDAALYAFKIGPGHGSWPMFCQNPSHLSHSVDGIQHIRWPLTEPRYLGDAANTWVLAKFVWCNNTINSAAIAWRIYFFDGDGNTNATAIKVFYVNMPIHNVAAVFVSPKKTAVEWSKSLSINATVANGGNFTETLNATLQYDSVEIGMQTLTLHAGETDVLTFEWNTTTATYGNYTLNLYIEPLLLEIDTSDNQYLDGWIYVTIAGDIAGREGWPDGKVDMLDVGYVARRFQLTPSEPMWDPNADVSDDGKIDMADIGSVARHFGETEP